MVTRTLLAPKADPLAQTVLQNVVSGIYDAQRQQEAARLRETARRGVEQRAKFESIIEKDMTNIRSRYHNITDAQQRSEFLKDAMTRLRTTYGPENLSKRLAGIVQNPADKTAVDAWYRRFVVRPRTPKEQVHAGKIKQELYKQGSQASKEEVTDTTDMAFLDWFQRFEANQQPDEEVQRQKWLAMYYANGGQYSDVAGQSWELAKVKASASRAKAKELKDAQYLLSKIKLDKNTIAAMRGSAVQKGLTKQTAIRDAWRDAYNFSKLASKVARLGGTPATRTLGIESHIFRRKINGRMFYQYAGPQKGKKGVTYDKRVKELKNAGYYSLEEYLNHLKKNDDRFDPRDGKNYPPHLKKPSEVRDGGATPNQRGQESPAGPVAGGYGTGFGAAGGAVAPPGAQGAKFAEDPLGKQPDSGVSPALKDTVDRLKGRLENPATQASLPAQEPAPGGAPASGEPPPPDQRASQIGLAGEDAQLDAIKELNKSPDQKTSEKFILFANDPSVDPGETQPELDVRRLLKHNITIEDFRRVLGKNFRQDPVRLGHDASNYALMNNIVSNTGGILTYKKLQKLFRLARPSLSITSDPRITGRD